MTNPTDVDVAMTPHCECDRQVGSKASERSPINCGHDEQSTVFVHLFAGREVPC